MIAPIILLGGAALGFSACSSKVVKKPEQPPIFTALGLEDKNNDGVINENHYSWFKAEEGYQSAIDGNKDRKITQEEGWEYLKRSGANNATVRANGEKLLADQLVSIINNPQTGAHLNIIDPKYMIDPRYFDEQRLFDFNWDNFLAAQHTPLLDQIVSNSRFNKELREKALSAADKRLITQSVLEKIALDPAENIYIRFRANGLLGSFYKIDVSFINAALPQLSDRDEDKLFWNHSRLDICLGELLTIGSLDNLPKLSNQQLKDLYLATSWIHHPKLNEISGTEILRRLETDSSLISFVAEHMRETKALVNFGDATTFQSLVRQLNSADSHLNLADLLNYAKRLEKSGQLAPKDRNQINKLVAEHRYEREADLQTFLSGAADSTSQIVRMAQRNLNEVASARRAGRVVIKNLHRESYSERCWTGFFDGCDPKLAEARRVKTPETFAYRLTLHDFNLPKNALSASLIIVDPRGTKHRQNCDVSGNKLCDATSNFSARIFLNTASKEVQAYLEYQDIEGKYIGVSNSFTITNPDYQPEPATP
ncbi:MAG: hypothetical protein MUC35_07285 [Candidatus Margulisbacteria bacterium]|jgi:hypothetical protein|nr:hypothetical protein [Candidatus Margulisiibacteriota bacterium]